MALWNKIKCFLSMHEWKVSDQVEDVNGGFIYTTESLCCERCNIARKFVVVSHNGINVFSTWDK